MARDHVGVDRFVRNAVLVTHGEPDIRRRPNALEFQARTGQRLVDWLAEVHVWIDRWPTREGVAMLLERAAGIWVPVEAALPFDGLYITRETDVKLVFGAYVELRPGVSYRLHCPNAVITRPEIRLVALQREPDQRGFATGPRFRARRGPEPSTSASQPSRRTA